LSGRGLCDELITRPEESYRLCCVVVCDLETSRMGAPYIYDISHLRVNISQRIICYNLLFFGRKNSREFWMNPVFQHREHESSKLKTYRGNLKKMLRILP